MEPTKSEPHCKPECDYGRDCAHPNNCKKWNKPTELKAEEHPLSQKPLIERITPGPWRQMPVHETDGGSKLPSDDGYRTIRSSDYPHSGFSISGFISPEDAEAISRVPELLKAEQENENFRKVNESQADDIIKYLRKISELEETISRKDAKLEAIIKGLKEIMNDPRSSTQYEGVYNRINTLLNTANKPT